MSKKLYFIILLFFLFLNTAWALDLSLNNIYGKIDDNIVVFINLSDAENLELDAFSVVLSYNDSILTYENVDKEETLVQEFSLVKGQITAPGKVKINGSLFGDPLKIQGNGVFLKVKFKVSTCGTSELKLLDLKNDIKNATSSPANFYCEKQKSSISDIVISNVTDSSVVISWRSSTDDKAMIRLGKQIENHENWLTVYDDRGETKIDDIHYVTISELDPESKYYFEIISGNTVENNNDNYHIIETGPPLIPLGSCLVAGRVFKDENKMKPLYDSIVYISIIEESQESSINSFLISPESYGYWYFDLVNLRTKDNKKNFSYKCGTSKIYLKVQAGKDGRYEMTTTAKNYITDEDRIPDMIPDQDHTITATTNDNIYGLIEPSGKIDVSHNASKEFKIIPNKCYRIKDLLVDGISLGALNSYIFNNIKTDHTIKAIFEKKTYTIEAIAGENGKIDPQGKIDIQCGSDQLFKIIPDIGYKIQNISIDGISKGAIDSFIFENVQANHLIEASFEKIKIKISASTDQGGTIDPFGEVYKSYGENQTFIIKPDSCHNIKDIIIDGLSVGKIDSYTFEDLTTNHTIHAVFDPIVYTINAISGENGDISPSGQIKVQCDSDKTFIFKPANECYFIYNVKIDGISIGQVSTYTFENINSNHTIEVDFKKYTYQINASAKFGGKIKPSGLITVECDSSHVFTITPNEGFDVYDVLIDGNSIGPALSYTLTNISKDSNILAIFGAVYEINEGFNLFSLTMQPEKNYTSKNLLNSFNDNGGEVVLIQRWSGSKWDTYSYGAPFGDFNIEVGKGYFLLANKKSKWLNNGGKWEKEIYNLNVGYNLFGFPLGISLQASSLLNFINNNDGDITTIRRWDGSGFESYVTGTPFGDFQIKNKEGYFLYSTKKSIFEIDLNN